MAKKFDLTKLKNEDAYNHQLLRTAENQGRVGRPPKNPTQKMSEKIILSFTFEEMHRIREKAGLIPLATYLRKELQRAKVF